MSKVMGNWPRGRSTCGISTDPNHYRRRIRWIQLINLWMDRPTERVSAIVASIFEEIVYHESQTRMVNDYRALQFATGEEFPDLKMWEGRMDAVNREKVSQQ